MWNQENLFCGWHDADLSQTGVNEAINAGEVCIRSKNCRSRSVKCSRRSNQIAGRDLFAVDEAKPFVVVVMCQDIGRRVKEW